MIAEIETVGHEDLIRLMVAAGAMAGPLMARMLRESGDEIMRESQHLVPLRVGPLKNSGRVAGPAIEGDNVMVSLSYGNTAVQYALFQHEGHRADGSYQVRNYHTEGTGPNYLSGPVERAIPTIAPKIAMKLQEILGNV